MENYSGLLFQSDPSPCLLISEEEAVHMEEKRLSGQFNMVSRIFFCLVELNPMIVTSTVLELCQTYLNDWEITSCRNFYLGNNCVLRYCKYHVNSAPSFCFIAISGNMRINSTHSVGLFRKALAAV